MDNSDYSSSSETSSETSSTAPSSTDPQRMRHIIESGPWNFEGLGAMLRNASSEGSLSARSTGSVFSVEDVLADPIRIVGVENTLQGLPLDVWRAAVKIDSFSVVCETYVDRSRLRG
mmetsp:Transcript_24509/g.53321  ORF Transcript_24509/g.53321 Transcript_24509/m.53321 type:complete len:117 (+) Transcript_24509:228-578(+)|eukprot:CAMPEP_0195006440 /NCGR_PEP_ID=MMETSP0326_2-20130528/6702_1 /TAXON_ID=2866 ORGANISM="Crypthecodinium cohnii, Strain Seligo" /NCGR_SAMPLE_ID=MMETSP0326_2 /ASSEMBLY_ACC=CAM_ASM_000348 /LENGTH=116 /DNA_ID=CAMNT_0040013215 /DNA_START=62 /DNA_END=412 /DNA_ORIENTATION=+